MNNGGVDSHILLQALSLTPSDVLDSLLSTKKHDGRVAYLYHPCVSHKGLQGLFPSQSLYQHNFQTLLTVSIFQSLSVIFPYRLNLGQPIFHIDIWLSLYQIP